MRENNEMETRTVRPNSNGYVPAPLDTSDVELGENVKLLGERLAANLHDVWGRRRVSEGWAYGPVRDDEKKTNPCMVFYNELTEEQKDDNRISAMEALRFIKSRGYSIVERKKPSMAEVYRMAWTDHGRRDDEINFDARVFVGVFGTALETDRTRLTKALHDFFVSLYELFGEKNALGADKSNTLTNSRRFRKYAHTRFALLSPLETDTERLAAKVAAGYGIETYRVVGNAAAACQGDLTAPDGDAVGFICDNSLLALAMWNGLSADAPGYDERMALMVKRALRGSTERLMELDMPDNITVYHMLTPADRSDKGAAGHALYGIRELNPYPLETGKSWYFRGGKSRAGFTDNYNKKRFARNVEKIRHFNRKVKLRRNEVMASERVGDLMPGLHGHTATDRDLLRHLYADSVSYKAQKKRDRQTKWMMWMAIIGLGAYSVMSDAPEVLFGLNTSALSPVLSALTLLFLTAAMCIFCYQRRTGSHDEYVVFRMMAECLRVQTYWRASGISESVEKEFGARSKLDFEWARYILRSWELENIISMPESKEFSPGIINEVSKIWYGREDEFSGGEYRHEKTEGVDQYGYARNKAETSNKDAHKENLINVISIAAAYGLTVVVSVLVIVSSLLNGSLQLVDYLILLASIVQIVVAGYSLYASSKDYERLANNYSWLCIEYQKAIIAGKYAGSGEKKREICRRTGREAVKEICGWALEFSRNEPGSPIS